MTDIAGKRDERGMRGMKEASKGYQGSAAEGFSSEWEWVGS